MPINLDILRGYLNHDEKMVTRFLQLFCTAVPEDLASLKKYFISCDYNMSSISAHGIKTQCAYLGLEDAKTIAHKLEQITSDQTDTEKLLEKLEFIILSEIRELKMTMKMD